MTTVQAYTCARADIDAYLARTGIRAGLRGYDYLGDLIAYLIRDPGQLHGGIMSAYRAVADVHGVKPDAVERAARYAISTGVHTYCIGESVQHYLGRAVHLLPRYCTCNAAHSDTAGVAAL